MCLSAVSFFRLSANADILLKSPPVPSGSKYGLHRVWQQYLVGNEGTNGRSVQNILVELIRAAMILLFSKVATGERSVVFNGYHIYTKLVRKRDNFFVRVDVLLFAKAMPAHSSECLNSTFVQIAPSFFSHDKNVEVSTLLVTTLMHLPPLPFPSFVSTMAYFVATVAHRSRNVLSGRD